MLRDTTLRRTSVGARRPLEPAPSSRGHRHRLQSGVSRSLQCEPRGPPSPWASEMQGEPRRRHDRCSSSGREAFKNELVPNEWWRECSAGSAI
jgi:hypothetical protein